MRVPVYYIETAWELVDDAFLCTHPIVEVEDVERDTMNSYGEHTTYITKQAYCVDCGEPVDDYDYANLLIEQEFEED